MKQFDIPTYYRSTFIGRIKAMRKDADPRKKDFSPTTLDFGPVRFHIARHFGFCYGVENAIEISYKALEDYGNAVSDRRKLYDGDNGMADRVTMIKSYLASFPGKRKSDHYIGYSRAIKGK